MKQIKQSLKKVIVFVLLASICLGNSSIGTQAAQVDTSTLEIKLSYTVKDQWATVKVQLPENKKASSITYVKGNLTDPDSPKWKQNGKQIAGNTFRVNQTSIYSVLVKDTSGNRTIETINVVPEFRAVWISYLDFSKNGYTESQFKAQINEMFDLCQNMNMNAVIVQVRPFGDAFYPSPYFPWSQYVSGKQGKDPGYDPLEYMVEAAHKRNLEFHAWMNPYRVTLNTTDYKTLSADNPAKIWKTDSNKNNDRNVLSYDKKLYYNPASKEVQNRIKNDIAYVVKNYDVDGIHFDDYFYPSFTTKNYQTAFDGPEYKQYKENCTKNGKTAMTIEKWRRQNVNNLIKGIYSTIKNINPSVQFGISPAGNITNLRSKYGNYVDIDLWLSKTGYVDYIAPQIYWSFQHKTAPYDNMVEKWASLPRTASVRLYAGIAVYKANQYLADDPGWEENSDVLESQVEYSRDTGEISGYCFFRYEHFLKSVAQEEISNLLSILD